MANQCTELKQDIEKHEAVEKTTQTMIIGSSLQLLSTRISEHVLTWLANHKKDLESADASLSKQLSVKVEMHNAFLRAETKQLNGNTKTSAKRQKTEKTKVENK